VRPANLKADASRDAPVLHAMRSDGENDSFPLVTVIAVNYNCKKWLERFFSSLRAQTIFNRVEVVLVDNTSTDGSAEICQKELANWPNGVFLPTGGNYGFGGGNNRGAAVAKGKYLLFVNPDVWLEPNCLEELVRGTEAAGAGAGSARLLDYDSDYVQTCAASGFDLFGYPMVPRKDQNPERPFVIATFLFIRRDLFQKLGGFDDEFFLYGEELDLSWRTWISGDAIVSIPSAKIHHQGVSSGDRTVENRTNESKRFYANRNHMIAILKNGRFALLLLILNLVMLIGVEAVIGAVFARRFSFVRWAFLKPLAGCWRLRGHIAAERRRIRCFRRRGDMWIIRHFFKPGFGRWKDVKLLLKSGVKIDKAR
jgi:GT2 family glycosyltransferase